MLNARTLAAFATAMLLCGSVYSADIDTVSVPSAAMDTSYNAIIVIPDSYYNNPDLQYPVVYVLHGWSGSYIDWQTHMDLRPLADEYNYILVCPDGGYAGWYMDSEITDSLQYETYIATEVPAYIDGQYRTITRTEGRGIIGLSMGGYGSIALLSKYPNQYIAGGSMSGVMKLEASHQRYGLVNILGSPDDYPKPWQNESAIQLVEKLQGKSRGMLIDCGVDDAFIEVNRIMHRRLLELEISHDYYERPGGHSWEYWTRALPYHLMYLQEWMASAE